MQAHPWFLDARERSYPGHSLVRDEAWTEGNHVEALVHGATYFWRLAAELQPLVPGDLVCLADWRGDDDEKLTDDGPMLATVLTELARRGVDVRGLLWRSHPAALGFNEEEDTELAGVVSAAGGTVLLDERVRRAGSHHQKLVVVHRPDDPDRDVALVGGIDLCHGRRDNRAHLGDPQAQHLDRRYGERAPWHDVQAVVAGPAVAQLLETFRERWNDPTPLERRGSPFGRRKKLAHERTVPDPLPPVDRAPMPRGSNAVQVLRTYPAKRPGYPFAPEGERTIARFYRKAFRARGRSCTSRTSTSGRERWGRRSRARSPQPRPQGDRGRAAVPRPRRRDHGSRAPAGTGAGDGDGPRRRWRARRRLRHRERARDADLRPREGGRDRRRGGAARFGQPEPPVVDARLRTVDRRVRRGSRRSGAGRIRVVRVTARGGSLGRCGSSSSANISERATTSTRRRSRRPSAGARPLTRWTPGTRTFARVRVRRGARGRIASSPCGCGNGRTRSRCITC